jgi:hypothetical protein
MPSWILGASSAQFRERLVPGRQNTIQRIARCEARLGGFLETCGVVCGKQAGTSSPRRIMQTAGKIAYRGGQHEEMHEEQEEERKEKRYDTIRTAL